MQEETKVLGENLHGQVWIENQIHIRLWPDWESNLGRIGERHGNNRSANPLSFFFDGGTKKFQSPDAEWGIHWSQKNNQRKNTRFWCFKQEIYVFWHFLSWNVKMDVKLFLIFRDKSWGTRSWSGLKRAYVRRGLVNFFAGWGTPQPPRKKCKYFTSLRPD